jgi:Cof subfamily protein (haloacid dehalogenase superfamily)
MTTPTDLSLTAPRPIRMVALDLDGTLVNDALAISSRVQAVINALVATTDIRVVIATGRMFSSSVHFAQTLGVHEPIIAYQGAIIRSQAAGTPTLFHQPVSIPISQALVTWFQRQPNCFLNVYQHDDIYTTPTNEFARDYARLSGIEPIYVDNLVDVVSQQPVSKFLGIFQGDIHPILADLDSDFGHDIHYCQSRSNFLEMIHRDVSKWTAVKHLADSWGIDAANILTVGDQENDLQMLANAGVGVAMGNAPAHVTAVAALQTASITDDGAALVLEHVLANGHIDFSALPPGVSVNVHEGAKR